MELKYVEGSRVVYLMTIKAHRGDPFVPDVIGSLVTRYKFQSYPTSFEELTANPRKLLMGSWNGVEIREMAAFNDGLVVEASCSTEQLDGFVDDVLLNLDNEFGLQRVSPSTEARHYESEVVVTMSDQIVAKMAFLEEINTTLAQHQRAYGLGNFDFELGAFNTSPDPTKHTGKRPIPFLLARRLNVPHSDGQWFSSAPLKTADHLKLLEKVETLMV